MSFVVEKHILRLEVTVDDSLAVKVLQSKHDFSCVESSSVLCEPDLIAKMEKELSTIEEVSDKVQALCGLECEMKFHDEWMSDLLHDVSLDLGVVHLVCANNEVLFERFHGVNLASVFLFGHVDLAKRASSDHFQKLEIFHAHLGLTL